MMASANNQISRNADIPAVMSNTLADLETARVHNAMNENRLELFYQPIVRSGTNNFVAFYEGLARIKMPEGAIISAGQFMPFVENTALGTRLDRQILRLALKRLDDTPDIRLSINMSVLSMQDSGWLTILESAATDTCERLIIEITEGAAMSDVELTTAFMHRVRRKHCSIALDDFGTGATSFRYFKDFLFDFVKIDGLFIRDLCYDKDNQVLVQALIDISKHFDMVTVAEFVETDGEAEMAAKLGIDCLQGYLIGEPTAQPIAPFQRPELDQKVAG
ncbi:MAG: diguanylate phosphodiesterase [Rhodobacteraceae bacterium]|nr:MAG: diguanylate phosphodiesterase [Paracoccaceae bacterium]